jgi:hypothetical protein
MKKLVIAAAFIAATLASQASFAAVYTETADAGQTLTTTKTVGAGTTSIVGSLGTGDFADVYKFGWNGGTFQASTSSNFDPMLFVFNSTGTKLAMNDDWFGFQSFISINLAAGTYLLGINNCCDNYNGNLDGFGTSGNGYGNYTISLSSTAAVSAVPEPSVVALLGLGLFGLGMSRRRKAV